MNMKTKIVTLFPLRSEVTMAILALVVLATLIAAVAYGDLTFSNPFWILCSFFGVHTLVRGLTSNYDNAPDPEQDRGITFGPAKIATGVMLASFAFQTTNNLMEVIFWTVVALVFVELGIKDIARSIVLMRKKYHKRVADLAAMNERARIEQEFAKRWQAEEDKRKQKVAIEEELISDLAAFLGNPDSPDIR